MQILKIQNHLTNPTKGTQSGKMPCCCSSKNYSSDSFYMSQKANNPSFKSFSGFMKGGSCGAVITGGALAVVGGVATVASVPGLIVVGTVALIGGAVGSSKQ